LTSAFGQPDRACPSFAVPRLLQMGFLRGALSLIVFLMGMLEDRVRWVDEHYKQAVSSCKPTQSHSRKVKATSMPKDFNGLWQIRFQSRN
jgi:hypothetical protein